MAVQKKSKCYFDIKINNEKAGRMVFELVDDLPKTTKNFKELCRNREHGKGYIGSSFHRVIDGFMAQGGDFTHHNGVGGRSIYGTKFDDEGFFHKHDSAGVLSMANAGKNTNGSQFFITFAPTEWLDKAHVVFGKVVEGMDVLKEIERYGTSSGKVANGAKIVIDDCGVLEE